MSLWFFKSTFSWFFEIALQVCYLGVVLPQNSALKNQFLRSTTLEFIGRTAFRGQNDEGW